MRTARKTRKKAARELPLFGIWKDRTAIKDVAAYVDNLRRGRH